MQDLTHAPELTDEEIEDLTPEDFDVWRTAMGRAFTVAECEHLWARRLPCATCAKPAAWYYDPATDNPTSSWMCPDCVPRGCSCEANAAYEDRLMALGEQENESEAGFFEPERDGARLADGRISPCMEWHPFTDPATLPVVEDLAGWAAREAAGQVP